MIVIPTDDDGMCIVAEGVKIFRCKCCSKVNIVFFDGAKDAIAFAQLDEAETMVIKQQFDKAVSSHRPH